MSSAAAKLKPTEIQTPPSAPALIGKYTDIVLVGGLSLAVYMLARVFFREDRPDNGVALFVFNLSFAVNFPHFLVSYQMLYGDFRSEILKKWRYFWAAVVVPCLLASALAAGYLANSEQVLGYSLNAMYFFVGWHYVKQIFGCMVVSNSLKKYYYSKRERLSLRANLYAIWAISFLNPNMLPQTYEQMGIHYNSLQLPQFLLQAAYAVLWMSLADIVWWHFRKYIKDGVTPTTTSVVALVSIYVWLIPAMAHPMYAHMIPLFHSLQYLLFVYAFRDHKSDDLAKDLSTEEGRKQKVISLWVYFAGSVVLGALSFKIIPEFIDSFKVSNLGATPAVFFATIFINVHHYFIDNVLWRGDNEQMRAYLFGRRVQR